jgi:hypothetical protein
LPQRAFVDTTRVEDGDAIDEERVEVDLKAVDADEDKDRAEVELRGRAADEESCEPEHFPKRGLHPVPQ